VLLLNVRNVTAQTTLAAGDLLFTAFDAKPAITATSAPFDRISFVALKKIDPNTVIYFTDLGYKSNAWSDANNNTEGVVKLTTSETIKLGEEVLLILTPGNYSATLDDNIVGVLEASSPRLSMGNTGDQLFAFQGGGGLPGGTGAVLITGMHWNVVQTGSSNNFTLVTNDAGWDNLSSTALSPTNSNLPPSLTAGQSAFFLGSIPNSSNGYNDYVASAAFNGANKPYANAAAIRTAVMNRNNWSRNTASTTGTYTIPSGHFAAVAVSPTISGVNSSTANGTYKIDDVISIQVNFSATVTVTGTPQLTLETGTTDRTINYISGSGTSTLSFSYTVQAGDISSDLDYTSTTALTLNGGTISDGSGNNAVLTLSTPGAANSLGANKAIVIDGVRPTVTISSTSASTTSISPIPVTVTFSESVTGFVAGDLTVVNGNVSDFSGSGTSYTFNVTPLANGTVTVNIPANVAQDAASNLNTAATQLSRTFTAATIASITRLSPSPTAATSVSYRIVFSTSVTGITTSNFSITTSGLSGASISSVSGSGATYTLTANTGTGSGTLLVNLANSTGITPTITNIPYTSGESYTITKSFAAAPTLRIQAMGSASGNGDVTAFVDVVQVLQSGSAVPNALQNGSFETNNVSPADFKYISGGVVSAPWSFEGQAGISRNSSAFGSTAYSGDAVAVLQSTSGNNGFISQNLAVPSGSYQISFQAIQRNYTSVDQRLTVFINDVFIGNIQPNNIPTYDTFTSAAFSVTAPSLTATVSTTSSSPTSTTPIPFSVSFSQSVGSTFTSSDISVSGGSINSASFSGSGAGPYTFTVSPSTSGTVSVSLAANVANDANNTANAASNTVSVQYTQPTTATPVLTTPANGAYVASTTPTYSGTAPASSTVTIYVDGTAIGTTTASSGGTFSLTQPTALAQGSHTVYATAQTSGATGSANSNTNTFIVDNVRPTVVITSTATSPTSTSPIPFTVTFSESVTGFVAGDVTVGNGTISTVNGSGTTYTFNVSPVTNGVVTVDVPANVAQDIASNGNTAATQFTINYLQVLPVTLVSYSAKVEGSATKLEWSTSKEEDNDRFEIERSADGKNFSFIGSTKSNSASSVKQNYFWYDRSPLNGNNYYRLLQIDSDGKPTELGVKHAAFTLTDLNALIYPNPAIKEVTVQFPLGTSNISVIDVNGKMIVEVNVSATATQHRISVGTLPSGNYFVRIKTLNGLITKKLVKL
ncbi:MAG: T9SS type A sorting domain-containing protein, partial [Sphingobacteriales bacterium]